MVIAALIISVLALLMATASVVLLLAQYFSTHKIEILDPKEMHKQLQELDKQDAKINEKVRNIESQQDDWL